MLFKYQLHFVKVFRWDADFEILPESFISQDQLGHGIGGQANGIKGFDGRSFDTQRPVQGIVNLVCASFDSTDVHVAVFAVGGDR